MQNYETDTFGIEIIQKALTSNNCILWLLDSDGVYRFISDPNLKNKKLSRQEKSGIKFETELRFGRRLKSLKIPIELDGNSFIFGVSFRVNREVERQKELNDFIKMLGILDSQLVNFFIKDDKGYYQYLSKGCLNQVEEPNLNLPIKDSEILRNHPETLNIVRSNDNTIIQNNSPWAGEENLVNSSGVKETYFVVKIPITIKKKNFIFGYSVNVQNYFDKIEGYQEEIKDLRHNIQVENEQNINRKISGINHDIASTINSSVQVLEVLKLTESVDSKVDYFESVSYSLTSLKSTIEMLVKEEFLGKGGVEEIKISDISDLINGMYKLSANAKNLEFKVSIDGTIHKDTFIKSIKAKLFRILLNMVNNSVKYTQRGYVKINISMLMNHLVIELEDSGPGFPEEVLRKIRQKRAMPEKEIKQNSGFGWFIINNYSLIIGAKLAVQNIKNGSRITIVLKAN